MSRKRGVPGHRPGTPQRWRSLAAWPALLMALGLGALALGAGIASVQAAEPPIRISTNAPLPLLVDGLESEKLPAVVALGSQVCVVAVQHYTTEVERWVFQGWSGRAPSTQECVILTQPGVYGAVYMHQVLLHIRSSVNQVQRSIWVEYGSPVDVTVPSLVEERERVRYRFQVWSDGETPTLPANRIAPLKPMTLEAKFTREYLVRVEGPEGVLLPGSGWYVEGASLVLQSPEVLPGLATADRLKFAQWETVGSPSLLIPDAAKPAITVKVDAPYTLRAVYDVELFIVASFPSGTLKREWHKAGDNLFLEVSPIIEIVPERERLVFKKWEGLTGLISPRVTGIIQGPLDLRAAYDRQVMVTLDAPYGGSGGGWQTPGTTVTVRVPGSAQSKLVFIRRFEGFAGYASGKSSIQVLVTEPITITAIYSSGVNVLMLGLLVAPLWLALLYVVSRWVLRLVPRRRSVD